MANGYPSIPAPATGELFELFQEYYKRLEATCNASETVACDAIPEALRLYQQGYVGEGLPYWTELGMKGYRTGLEGMRESIEQAMPEPTISLNEEQIGGSLYLVPRDEEGNIIANSPYFKSLGPVGDEGLTDWQQAQLANWQQEFQLGQQQLQMQQQQAMMPYGQMTAYQKAQMGLAEQAQYAETMSMPPSGWIEQWYRMQGGQPSYQPQSRSQCRMTEEEYARRLGETVEKAGKAIGGWERGQSLPSDMPLPGNWVYVGTGAPTPPGGISPRTISPLIQEP